MDQKSVWEKAVMRLVKEKTFYEKELEHLTKEAEEKTNCSSENDQRNIAHLDSKIKETKGAISEVIRKIGNYTDKINSK